jgi:hypothetical protein
MPPVKSPEVSGVATNKVSADIASDVDTIENNAKTAMDLNRGCNTRLAYQNSRPRHACNPH